MSNHAPGPWYVGETRLGYDIVIRSKPKNDPICLTIMAGYTKKEARANAAFIVRAANSHVAMLDALKAFQADGPTLELDRIIKAAIKLAEQTK